MNPVQVSPHEGGHLVQYAQDQDYVTLPASIDKNGLVMTEWALTDEELSCLLAGGHLRIWFHTFNRPLETIFPLTVEAIKPECGCIGES